MARTKPTRLVVIVGTLFLLMNGAGLGFVLSEATYRIYLYKVAAPERFVRPAKSGFAVNDKPMWRYDERFGYVYPLGEELHISGISGGRVPSCAPFKDFNRDRNVGRVVGNYATSA